MKKKCVSEKSRQIYEESKNINANKNQKLRNKTKVNTNRYVSFFGISHQA